MPKISAGTARGGAEGDSKNSQAKGPDLDETLESGIPALAGERAPKKQAR